LAKNYGNARQNQQLAIERVRIERLKNQRFTAGRLEKAIGKKETD
jgi:hypothetical protein